MVHSIREGVKETRQRHCHSLKTNNSEKLLYDLPDCPDVAAFHNPMVRNSTVQMMTWWFRELFLNTGALDTTQFIHFFSIGYEQAVIMDFACGLSQCIFSLLIVIYHPIGFSFPLERSFISNSYAFIYILCS